MFRMPTRAGRATLMVVGFHAMAAEQQIDAIVVRWSPVPEDLREVVTRAAFRRQVAKAMLVAAALFAAGVLLMLNAAFRFPGVIAATGGGILLLLMSVAYRRVAQLRWRNDPLARDPVEYTFGADGILRRQADFECRWGWPRILGVEESPAAFILRLGDGRASDGPMLLVAKRGIVAPADEPGLRALLGRYVPGRLTRVPARADRHIPATGRPPIARPLIGMTGRSWSAAGRSDRPTAGKPRRRSVQAGPAWGGALLVAAVLRWQLNFTGPTWLTE